MSLPRPSGDAVCVITGASSGLGIDLAKQMAALGHSSVLVARRVGRLEELAAALRCNYSIDVYVVPCDLTSTPDRLQLFERVSQTGRVVNSRHDPAQCLCANQSVQQVDSRYGRT